jgi:hypothetical protein
MCVTHVSEHGEKYIIIKEFPENNRAMERKE